MFSFKMLNISGNSFNSMKLVTKFTEKNGKINKKWKENKIKN